MHTEQAMINRTRIQGNILYIEKPIIPQNMIPQANMAKMNQSAKRPSEYGTTSHGPTAPNKRRMIKKPSQNIFQLLGIVFARFIGDEDYFHDCIPRITEHLSKIVANVDGPNKARGCRFYTYNHRRAIAYTSAVFHEYGKCTDNIIFKHLLSRITSEFKNSGITICFEIVFFYFRRHQRYTLIYDLFSNIANFDNRFDPNYLDQLHKTMLEKFTAEKFSKMWGTFIYPITIQYIQDISKTYFNDVNDKNLLEEQKKLLAC